MNKAIGFIAMAVAFGLTSVTSADWLVDYGNSSAAAPTFGGTWNVLTSDAGQALLDDQGNATGVTISFGGTDGWIVSANDQGSWIHGDTGWVDDLASNDYFFNTAGDSSTVTFGGLTAGGLYQIDHLAVRSLGPGRIADYTINGSFADSTPNGQGFDHLTDGWDPGNWLTWNSVAADGNGEITIVVDNVIGFGYISGSRISQVPEPTTAGLLAIATVGLISRRRKS